MTTLYKELREYLPKATSWLSDSEFLLKDRVDYNINQLSPVHATIESLGVKVGYPYRVLMGFVDSIAISLVKDDFNVIITDQSLAIAGYLAWVRSGGSRNIGMVYAPKGIPTFPKYKGIVAEIFNDFNSNLEIGEDAKPNAERLSKYFTFVLGNCKSSSQTSFALENFKNVTKGILFLKDFAKTDSSQERELMESMLLFPSVTFEGHGYIIKNG
jgi:hypothetical protein